MAERECGDAPSGDENHSAEENSTACVRKSIYDLISGDTYEGLKRSFLTTGKGRRPDPPSVPFTNLLLLMLHSLRVEGDKTAKEMSTWFVKLFPDTVFPVERLGRRIERTVDKAMSLTGTSALDIFVNEPINFDSLSASLDECGLDRKNIIDISSWTKKSTGSVILRNEMIIDLELFRSRERLKPIFIYQWILCLLGLDFLNKIFLDLCKKKVEKLISEYKVLLKKKGNKEEKLSAFFHEIFIFNSENQPLSPSLKPQCETNKNPELVALRRENSSFKNKIKDLEETVNAFKLDIDLLKEQLREAQKNFFNFKMKFEEASEFISKLKNRIKCNDFFQNKVKALRASLKKSSKINSTLKQKILNEQKRASKFGKKLREERIKSSILKEKVKLLHVTEFEHLDVNLKGNRNNVYTENLRTTVIALVCEGGVAAANVGMVISIVAKGIFNYVFQEPLPSKKTVLNMCDEAHVLSNIQVVERVLESSDITLHSDGTSRDHKKIVGHQFTLNSGEQFYLGFTTVASEDSNTLLDITLSLIRKLSDCFSALRSDSSERIYKNILSKISSIMTDRAATMKLFDKKFYDYLKSEIGSNTQVHFLHCNAHFLLGISNSCEKALVLAEKKVIESVGDPLGRDKDKRFSHFGDSESATNRLIRTLCDILGPRGDQKNGCRTEWLTFCTGSLIPSFKSNRFNCFFEAAAAIAFHHSVLIQFFTSGVLHDNPNLKIQSVALDVQDPALMTFICAIALLYLKVTGPYWVLVNSKVKYVDFYKYVQMLVTFLEQCSHNPALLFDSSFTSVFGPDISFKSPTFLAVHSLAEQSEKTLLESCIIELVKEISEVTKRQLGDFLNDGCFAVEADDETLSTLKHCPLTNLIGESAFGDIDYDFSKRRNCSVFNRSAIHTVKRNKTVKFIENKDSLEQQKLFSIARRLDPKQRLESKREEENVKQATREKFLDNQQKKIDRRLAEISRNSKINDMVQCHGGPCRNSKDVDELLVRLKNENKSKKKIEEIIKNEIRFINMSLGKRTLHFGSLDIMIQSLKKFFGDDGIPPSKKRCV